MCGALSLLKGLTKSTTKDEIAKSGVTAELTHSALEQLQKSLEDIQAKLKPVQDALASYHNLPPVILQ